MKAQATTQEINLSVLEETEGNPQEMTDKEFEGLKKSIKTKGFILDDPVVWEYEKGKYKIISGHHRIKAAQEVGYEKLNCKVITGITEKQGKLLVLEANQRRGKFNPILFIEYINTYIENFNIDMNKIYDDIGMEIEKIILKDTEKEINDNIITTNICPQCGYQW